MATNKTLNPTNVTIAIPAMSDKPDASVFSNCIDKTVDAVNTLNSKFVNYFATLAEFKSYLSAMASHSSVPFIGESVVSEAVTSGMSPSTISGTLAKISSSTVDIRWATVGNKMYGITRYTIGNDTFVVNDTNRNSWNTAKVYSTETLQDMYSSISSNNSYEIFFADTAMTGKLSNNTVTNGTGYGFALKTPTAVEFLMFVPSARYMYTGRINSSGELLYPKRVQFENY